MPYRIPNPFDHGRIGHRGAFLLIVGILQLIIGWATIAAPAASVKFLVVARVIPFQVLGWAQIALALVAVANAFWPPGRDRLGFMAAYPMPMLWGVAYLIATVTGAMPGGVLPGVRATAFWWGYAALILLVSGMVGVKDAPRPEQPRGWLWR